MTRSFQARLGPGGWRLALSAILLSAVAVPTAAVQTRGVSSLPRGLSSAPIGLSSMPRAAIGGSGLVGLGGIRGGSMVSTPWRALPSASLMSRRASGMMPSEIRGGSLASGSRMFSGGAARINPSSRGSMRYSSSSPPSGTLVRRSPPPNLLASPQSSLPVLTQLGGSRRSPGGSVRYSGLPSPTSAIRKPPRLSGAAASAVRSAPIVPTSRSTLSALAVPSIASADRRRPISLRYEIPPASGSLQKPSKYPTSLEVLYRGHNLKASDPDSDPPKQP